MIFLQSETDVAELQKQSPAARKLVAGTAPSVPPTPGNLELYAFETRLQMLQQTHAMVLESIPESERAEHKAVLDEFDMQEAEMKKTIAELKTAQEKRQAIKQGQRYVVAPKKE